jgi:hypothetical protein
MPSFKSKAPPNDADLFALDAEGSQAVREKLQRTMGLPKQRKRLLKSDEILQNSSSVPAFMARPARSETSAQRERRVVGYGKKVARRVKAVGLKKDRTGRGLLDVAGTDKSGQELSLAAAEAGSYDLWNAPLEAAKAKVRFCPCRLPLSKASHRRPRP